MWQDKADDIIGEPLDSFTYFMANTYLKKTTKFSFTMRELRQAIVSWCKYENMKRHGALDAVTTGNGTET